MNSARLIDLVCARDPLWNPKSNFYHNREMKHLLWTEIAGELGVSRETVRTKWSCLRDSFRRELKKRNDSGFLSKGQWPFFNRMLFLTTAMNSKDSIAEQDFFSEVTGEATAMIPTPQIVLSIGAGRDVPSDDADVPTTSETVSSMTDALNLRIKEEPTTSTSALSKPLQRYRSVGPSSPTLCNVVKERRRLRKMRKKLKKEKERDGDYHFALSLVSSMKKVGEEDKMKMRVAVMDTVATFIYHRHDKPDQSTCDNSNFACMDTSLTHTSLGLFAINKAEAD